MHGYHHFSDESRPGLDLHILKRLLSYARPYAAALCLSLFLILVVAAIQLAQPYILKIAIDDYILGPGSAPGLQKLGILFLLLYTAGMFGDVFLHSSTKKKNVLVNNSYMPERSMSGLKTADNFTSCRAAR